jgi:hypothetical protein
MGMGQFFSSGYGYGFVCPLGTLPTAIPMRGDKVAAPQDGPQLYVPLEQGVGSPAADASGAAVVDVLGLPLAKVAGLRSSTSATMAALSSWPRTGRSGMTTGGGASTIPTSAATGGSTSESVMAPTGVDAGTDNKSGGLGAAAVSAASPSMMAALIGGSAGEACPMATHAAWAPRRRAPCVEANQPAWRATAPAAEAGFVLRPFVGARPAKPCLRLLKERDDKFKTHSEKTRTEVSLDAYPLRGKANRACGEAPRAPVSAGAADGGPAAGGGAASASGARGAKGAALPGVDTTAGGSLACLRRRFSKASRARILSRARAFSASFFSFSFSAASLCVARSAASSGTGGRAGL